MVRSAGLSAVSGYLPSTCQLRCAFAGSATRGQISAFKFSGLARQTTYHEQAPLLVHTVACRAASAGDMQAFTQVLTLRAQHEDSTQSVDSDVEPASEDEEEEWACTDIGLSSADVLGRIEEFTASYISDLAKGLLPKLSMVSRSSANVLEGQASSATSACSCVPCLFAMCPLLLFVSCVQLPPLIC